MAESNKFSQDRSPGERFQTAAFFFKRAALDLISPNRFGVSTEYHPGKSPVGASTPYVLDYSAKGMLSRYDMRLDSNGIAMIRHYIHQGDGYYHSPVKIAHFGLACLNDALAGRPFGTLAQYRTHLDWLIANYTEEFGGVVWRVPSSAPKYELAFNYVSAISQGLALSLLARTEEGRVRARAAELSESALAPLRVTVADGGLLATGKWGPCYEEYPTIPFGHVVNGFVFCLNGLFDCYSAFGLLGAKELFDSGLQTLREMTKVWFVRGWARYDLRDLYSGSLPNLATRHYQYLHSDQMKGLAVVTGDVFWAHLARRFERQAMNPAGIAYSYYCKARKFL